MRPESIQIAPRSCGNVIPVRERVRVPMARVSADCPSPALILGCALEREVVHDPSAVRVGIMFAISCPLACLSLGELVSSS
jgi:hypothetical protein